MKILFSLLAISTVVLISCKKDRFQTKPTIKVKEINGNFVPVNGKFVITLEATDKEGDVQDSVIIIKQRLNKRVVATIRDTLRYKFPTFPKNNVILVQAELDYQSILSAISPPFIPNSTPPKRELDTLRLRLAVRDNAGNTSDTIDSPVIYVERQ
jgi:hypothetical protein